MVLYVARIKKEDGKITISWVRGGILATLKGEQMQNKSVQIPYELFFSTPATFLMDNYDV